MCVPGAPDRAAVQPIAQQVELRVKQNGSPVPALLGSHRPGKRKLERLL